MTFYGTPCITSMTITTRCIVYYTPGQRDNAVWAVPGPSETNDGRFKKKVDIVENDLRLPRAS